VKKVITMDMIAKVKRIKLRDTFSASAITKRNDWPPVLALLGAVHPELYRQRASSFRGAAHRPRLRAFGGTCIPAPSGFQLAAVMVQVVLDGHVLLFV
jgi:hypothetical protein